VGEREQNEDKVAVRQRGRKDLGAISLSKFLEKIEREINERVIE